MFGINVYRQRVGSFFKGRNFQKDILVLEDRIDTLPRNVGNKLPIDAAQHPRRLKTSRKLPLLQNVQTGSGDHPASYSMDTGATSQEVKRPGRETGRSPKSSAEVKNGWSYNSTLYAFVTCTGTTLP
jgi:hypothetical protein